MTVREQSSRVTELTESGDGHGHLAAHRGPAPGSQGNLAEADLAEADLAEADRLISDLGALLDAGLLVVHESVLGPARYGLGAGFEHGPARYGIGPDLDDAA